MEYLVIDIGGSFIKHAVMDEKAAILSRGKIPTPQEGREALVSAISALYKANPHVCGLAISMPGIIDSAKGLCHMGGALRYNDGFHFAEALAEHIPLPIYMENDAKCAAMAEASLGSLSGCKNGLVIVFGTMIGGGIIIDGKLYKGGSFSAGEVSYIIPRPDMAAGFYNVWGNASGTPALCRLYAELKGVDAAELDGFRIFDAAEAGEAEALQALRQYSHDIAVQLFSLQNILDPERIAIGGGISARPLFIRCIREALEQLYAQCPFKVPRADIVPCAFLSDANLIGALQCFMANMQ